MLRGRGGRGILRGRGARIPPPPVVAAQVVNAQSTSEEAQLNVKVTVPSMAFLDPNIPMVQYPPGELGHLMKLRDSVAQVLRTPQGYTSQNKREFRNLQAKIAQLQGLPAALPRFHEHQLPMPAIEVPLPDEEDEKRPMPAPPPLVGVPQQPAPIGFGHVLPGVHRVNVGLANLPEQLRQQLAKPSQLRLLDKRKLDMRLEHQFPYHTGEFVIDHNNHGERFEGFVRVAQEADPMAGQSVDRIGNHIEIVTGKYRYEIVIHKGVPPKGMKILVLKLRHHLESLRKAHMEIRKREGTKTSLVIGGAQLRKASPKQLARKLLQALGKKAHVRLVLIQTHMGGSLGNSFLSSHEGHRNLLRGY